jgi:hypothetical protein
MSVASGVIAFGANTGTLGLAGGQAASPAPVTAPAPATAATTPAAAAQTTTARSSHDEETAHNAANPSAERAPQGGEHDD